MEEGGEGGGRGGHQAQAHVVMFRGTGGGKAAGQQHAGQQCCIAKCLKCVFNLSLTLIRSLDLCIFGHASCGATGAVHDISLGPG